MLARPSSVKFCVAKRQSTRIQFRGLSWRATCSSSAAVPIASAISSSLVSTGAAVLLVAFVLSCASPSETGLKMHLEQREELRAQKPNKSPTRPGVPDSKLTGAQGQASSAEDSKRIGTVSNYLAEAMENSPELKAAFDRWQASVQRVSRSRRLPDPVLSFGYFVRSVETRVGPQRARIGLSQAFPWPTRLTANAEAASASARSAETQFDALALRIRSEVVTAYYRLWLIRTLRRIHSEHLEVLRSLSETTVARVAIGATTLSEQQQVDLSVVRLEDRLASMDQDEAAAKAQLRATLGRRGASQFPTIQGPGSIHLPSESEEVLANAAAQHPLLQSIDHRATAHEETARALRAEAFPSFSLGADWIITDQARMPDVADSGKDAVVVGGGISLPLWGSYGENADAARSEARAARSERIAGEDRALSELATALAQVKDAVRRVRLYETTLVPQADSAYASVLGSYATGRGTVAQTLLSQKDLLDIRGELERARAEYAVAWARLEQVVGREVQTAEPKTPTAQKAAESQSEEMLDENQN